MKTVSGTLEFIGLAVLGVLIAGCWVTRSLRLNNVVYCVEIGDPKHVPPIYVDLRHGSADEGLLRAALAKAKHDGGNCDITWKRNANATEDPNYCNGINASLKTDRVFKSELASNRRGDSSSGARSSR